MADEAPDVGLNSQEVIPAAQTPAAAPSDDLESVLASIKQYREEATPPVATPSQQPASTDGQRGARDGTPGGNEAQKPAAIDSRRLEQIEARLIADDLSRAIGDIKTAQPALKTIGDGVVKAMLNDAAQRDPRIMQAWVNRGSDPATFNKVLRGLSQKFAADLPSPADNRADGERGAAITAARGATKPTANAAHETRVRGMSDADFDQAWNKRAFG